MRRLSVWKILVGTVVYMVAQAPAHASLITSISNLNIGGILYDVTLHDESNSFNALWDSNGDQVFGNDASLFNAEPFYWHDEAGAQAAAAAIIAELGLVDTTSPGGDRVFVPFDFWPNGNVKIHGDLNLDPASDGNIVTARIPPGTGNGVVYASFVQANVTAPEPASFLLLIIGLLGLPATQRWKRVVY